MENQLKCNRNFNRISKEIHWKSGWNFNEIQIKIHCKSKWNLNEILSENKWKFYRFPSCAFMRQLQYKDIKRYSDLFMKSHDRRLHKAHVKLSTEMQYLRGGKWGCIFISTIVLCWDGKTNKYYARYIGNLLETVWHVSYLLDICGDICEGWVGWLVFGKR